MIRQKLGKVGMAPRGEYDPSAVYSALDIVKYNGSSYLVLKGVSGVEPAEGEHYTLLAEAGHTGDKGDKGDAGKGLTILGHFASEGDLLGNVSEPSIGDAYGVGTEPPYDVYLYDGEGWRDWGKLQGEKGDKGDRGDAFTYDMFTEGQLEALRGPKGDTGEQGAKGDRGDTGPAPTRGKDYWTESDRQGIIDELEADGYGAKKITYGTEDLEHGVSFLETGCVYLVIDE